MNVDDSRLRAADSDRSNWLTHGRTYSEQRYSPLDEINTTNVAHLAAVWTFFTGQSRGHESTPIVVDGVLYFTSAWSIVHAVDARNGAEIWRYDPQVPRDTAAKACCDVVNRGVAVYRGRVYGAALDGRLFALDARDGRRAWEVMTVDPTKPYTITGAPRIVKGNVIIGNGGADFGVRGYVSAYDAETGELRWRTFTVPGDPARGFESPALAAAATTWKGEHWWEFGGGGTVWDSIAFDPDLDLLFIGTGNGSPWARNLRSPGGGDNLYLASILALRPDSGELVWYYQTTPGETWDYAATQHLVLADLEIAGRLRKVLLQAPKNGFFYVLDRSTGQLVSAEKFVTVNWAERIDLETGRPVEVSGKDYTHGLAIVQPSAFGGHNWQPMSFSPRTGLVYIPTQDVRGAYRRSTHGGGDDGTWNTGTDLALTVLLGPEQARGALVAWDPVRQREVWRHPYALPWNGGTLATAGGLVFQGSADGRFLAFDAANGKQLWEAHVGTGIGAGPVTYEVDGKQYVSVVAGWGGSFALTGGEAAAISRSDSRGRLVTYTLTDETLLPEDLASDFVNGGGTTEEGERAYHRNCAMCHGARGVSGSAAIPDLRRSELPYETFDAVVRQGLLAGKGMPNLARWVTASDTLLIKRYLDSERQSATR